MIRPFAALLPAVFAFAIPAFAQDVGAADSADPVTMSTQGRGGPALGFTLGAGVGTAPEYFGSDDNEARGSLNFALNHLRIGRFEFGDPDPLFQPEGLGVIGSFRYIGERDDDDSSELEGLDDVDASLELGAGLRYATQSYQVFGVARYGVVGHNAWVGEIGADAFARPTDRLTLRIGPRALFGSESFNETYFGITGDEADASGSLGAFDPDGGLVSTGVEVGAGYRLGGNWGVDAAVRYDRLRDDASDSPIVEDVDQLTARIGVTRRFTFGF